MWKLSIEDDQGNKTVVHLLRDEYSVGREEASTVRLTERNISRKHLGLVREDSHWLIVDKQSYNGVYVNGTRIADKRALVHGDIVQLGDYRMTIADEALEHKDTIPQEVPRASLVNQDRLVVVAGLAVGTEFPLTGERLLLGRGEECDIVLNHPSVSRVHSEISALGDGRYEFIDKESANGVRINGVDLKRSLLDARDTIELGDVALKFIPAGQPYQPALDRSLATLYAEAQPEPLPQEGVAPPAKPAPRLLKLGLLGLAALVLLLGLLWLGTRGNESVMSSVASSGQDPIQQTLAIAVELHAKGNIEDAHQKLAEIPEDSNLRQSAEFRKIEGAWAKALFQQAERETNLTAKRALLETIALSPTADTLTRARARGELSKLSEEALDVSQLPVAPAEGSKPAARPAPGKPAPKVPKGGIVRENPYE